MDIFEKIQQQVNSLTIQDLDWMVSETMVHYHQNIDRYAAKAYPTKNQLAVAAFRASAQETLRRGLDTFIFKYRHWENDRDLNSYLLLCLKRLAEQIYWEQSGTRRANQLICPGCRELNQKIFLRSENKLWSCENCESELERLTKVCLTQENSRARALITLHKAFVKHSRRGIRCGEPSCNRFIPETLIGKHGIQCPYLDCDFFGSIEELQPMTHPCMLVHLQNLSLNEPYRRNKNPGGGTESIFTYQDKIKDRQVAPDDKISIQESFDKEYKVLLSVIDSQTNLVSRSNDNTKFQKLLMYQAFRIIAEKNPEEMVSYLVHLKQTAETPIQARIFQEYIGLIENALPFSLHRRGEKIEILSISDPCLGLFTGVSTFDTIVKDNGVIPNDTVETYIGGRKCKCFGPCFIGKLISLVDKTTGQSLISSIKSYNFNQIDSTVAPGTSVTVTHYRIPSHYELGHLVHLQRIRKLIVDKIFFLLNGRKRKTLHSQE